MTVIKGNNKSYFVRPTSAQVSDTESLHLGSASASDTESLNNEPVPHRLFHNLPARTVQVEEPVNLKKSSGKKKVRRFQNRCILQTLLEEDDSESTLVVIVDPYKSPFARLLEDLDAMKFWNDFVEKSEEEQTHIINAFSEHYHTTKVPVHQEGEAQHIGRVSSRVKRTFKTKKNLSLESVKTCEDNLLNFFNVTPKDVYVQSPSTSFERLLLKAIAHYHGLEIKCVPSSNDRSSKPCIEIFNTRRNWVPASCFLTDFIKQLR